MATRASAIPIAKPPQPLRLSSVDEVRVVFPLISARKNWVPKWVPTYKPSIDRPIERLGLSRGIGTNLNLSKLVDSLQEGGFNLCDAYTKKGKGGLLVVIFKRDSPQMCKRRAGDLLQSCFGRRLSYEVTEFSNYENLGIVPKNILLKCDHPHDTHGRYRSCKLIAKGDKFQIEYTSDL